MLLRFNLANNDMWAVCTGRIIAIDIAEHKLHVFYEGIEKEVTYAFINNTQATLAFNEICDALEEDDKTKIQVPGDRGEWVDVS